MNINNPEELKKYFEEFKELVKNEEADKAMHMLEELLKSIEEQVKVRRAGSIDARGNISISEPQDNCEHIYMSLNHVMEYYVYACYFEPETDVLCTELPVGEYYRTYGSLCLKLSKFRRAEDAFKKADMSTVKSIFTGAGSYGKTVQANASMIYGSAVAQLARISGSSTYGSTGSYSYISSADFNKYL